MFSQQSVGSTLSPGAARARFIGSGQGDMAVWDRFVSLAPQERDTSITYRVRSAQGQRRGSVDHPYHDSSYPDQTPKTVQGKTSAGDDHYALLGVAPDAPIEVIEQAYRQQVRFVHPDKFSHNLTQRDQAERTMKQLNAAVWVLREPDQRAAYDRMLPAPPLARRLAAATRCLKDQEGKEKERWYPMTSW